MMLFIPVVLAALLGLTAFVAAALEEFTIMPIQWEQVVGRFLSFAAALYLTFGLIITMMGGQL